MQTSCSLDGQLVQENFGKALLLDRVCQLQLTLGQFVIDPPLFHSFSSNEHDEVDGGGGVESNASVMKGKVSQSPWIALYFACCSHLLSTKEREQFVVVSLWKA